MLTKRKGQSIVEYVLIFGVVTAGAIASFAAISSGGGAQQAFESYVTGQSGTTQGQQGQASGGGGSGPSGAQTRAAE